MKPRRRRIKGLLLALPLLGALGFATWLAQLPPRSAPGPGTPVPAAEHADALRALAFRGEGRPLIAVIGINDATETNDYLMTLGVLRRAGRSGERHDIGNPGPVKLYPALTVLPDATTAVTTPGISSAPGSKAST